MNHGLEPTQREEWKKKHRIRFFFEDRLLELRDILAYGMNIISNFFTGTYYICKKVIRDKYLVILLLTIFFVSFIMLI
jgi:hypothetical protein